MGLCITKLSILASCSKIKTGWQLSRLHESRCQSTCQDRLCVVQGALQRQHAAWAACLQALVHAAAARGGADSLGADVQHDAAVAVVGLATLAGQARGQLLQAVLQPLLQVLYAPE